MPVQSDAGETVFEGWPLRVRPAASSPARPLLLIHGRTGDENSMWVFARDLPQSYWILAPRGPHEAMPEGYSWIPPASQVKTPISLEDLRPAAESLLRLIDRYSDSVGMPVGPLDIMGFSEGAALSIALALQHPKRVNRLGILAGFAPEGVAAFLNRPLLHGKDVFVAHGRQDRLVPIESSRRTVELLQRAGAQVQVCEAEIGHKVGAGCLRALRSFFA